MYHHGMTSIFVVFVQISTLFVYNFSQVSALRLSKISIHLPGVSHRYILYYSIHISAIYYLLQANLVAELDSLRSQADKIGASKISQPGLARMFVEPL